MINQNEFLSFLGMAVFAYEGVGVIIPVMELA
jgi:hypothetical protein